MMISNEKLAPAGTPPQPDLNSNDPYTVLGLPRTASERDAKRAYFNLVRQFSPEENPEAFKKIRAAYEKLKTAEAKAETDLFLFHPPTSWTPRKRRGKYQLVIEPADLFIYLESFSDLYNTNLENDFRPINL